MLACALLLAAAPAGPGGVRHANERLDWSFLRDAGLYRLAAIHAFSFGFSVIVGNWIVTLLAHHGESKSAAAAVGSLTLLHGFVNAWAALTIVAGTPLVGLTFSLPGDGRIGFAALGVLASLAALATPR